MGCCGSTPEPEDTDTYTNQSATSRTLSLADQLSKWQQKYKDIDNQPYYHDLIPRDEVDHDNLLQAEGEFLVRFSERNDLEPLILSVFWNGRINHIPIGMERTGMSTAKYDLGGQKFENVPDLLIHVAANDRTVGASRVKLRKAIVKDEFQLKNKDVELGAVIGTGNFGEVCQGKLHRGSGVIDVAVKTIRTNLANETEKRKFLAEARLMRMYRHENIVRFRGICLTEHPFMIVMDLVPGGSMDKYLIRHKRDLDQGQLFLFCQDTCLGMAYLESQSCIHRDLAARNCLLAANPKTKRQMVKISDFGMSREGHMYKIQTTKKFPIRWTAPEVLKRGVYTSKSDVWSYGVLMWEIFTFGEVPYLEVESTKDLVDMVVKGHRLEIPRIMPGGLVKIMQRCWMADPAARKTFREMRRDFQNTKE